MLTEEELRLVARVSRDWRGPNAWGYVNGYRFTLAQALELPGFG